MVGFLAGFIIDETHEIKYIHITLASRKRKKLRMAPILYFYVNMRMNCISKIGRKALSVSVKRHDYFFSNSALQAASM